ncbi:MAG: antitoxin [Actinomycetota bacterium]|nr:antitoxin [Actinomycetota bacterium]
MGIDDLMGQGKDLLAGHETEVDEAIDKAAAAKNKTPDQVDDAVDAAEEKAKDALRSLDRDKGGSMCEVWRCPPWL